jgi:phosphoribosylformimino-5-aminoimidazole carboxamide ribotide isomerase
MLILPAIDLQGGLAVRLLRGAFDNATRYGEPANMLHGFIDAGATWTHIVDLDGAKAGVPAQHGLIASLAATTRISIQAGGGVRAKGDVERLLNAGVARVVVGSTAVRNPLAVTDWLESFGVERICVALDVRREADAWCVAVDGWASGGGKTLEAALAAFPAGALRHVIVTDISRDGALSGSNVDLVAYLARLRPDISFQASGGVATLDDIKAQQAAGAGAIIIGRALYERRFTLEEALAI